MRRRWNGWLLASIPILLWLSLWQPQEARAWWNTSWNQRIKVTFDNSFSGSATLDNFPVMVKLTTDRVNYSQIQADGDDIRFVDSDDATELYFEVEKWAYNGTSYFWVKVPNIPSGSSTDYIYVYYGHATAGASSYKDPSNVWSNGYQRVYHMHDYQLTGGYDKLYDSKTEAYTPFVYSDPPITAGLIGNALSFDGSTQYVDTQHTWNYAEGAAVYEVVYKATSFDPTTTKYLLGLRQDGATGNDSEVSIGINVTAGNTDGLLQFNLRTDDPETQFKDYDPGNVFDGSYHYVVLRRQSSSYPAKGYLDGNKVTDGTYSTVGNLLPSSCEDMHIAVLKDCDASVGGHFKGIIDEVRISNTDRSEGWIKAQNNSMMEGGFTTYGPRLTVIYYSVGTAPSALYSGNASASIGVLRLASAAADNIGVGDEIREGSNRYYITGRNSLTQFTIQTPTGGTSISFGNPSPVGIEIWRAFSSLSAADSGSRDGNHLNLSTGDLVTGNYQLNWPCYADGEMTSGVTIDGANWTTSPGNYIKIYTPTSRSEVGTSQRHDGTWGTGFRMTPASTSSFIVSEDYVRIEGIAMRVPEGVSTSAISVSGSFPVNSDVRISHCLMGGITGASYNSRAVYINDSNANVKVTIWNTIAYKHGIAAFQAFDTGTLYVYNTTAYNNKYGFQQNTGTVILKNCISIGNTEYDYTGTFDNSSNYNMSGPYYSSDTKQAPGPDIASGTTQAGTTTTTVKVSSTSGITVGDWFNNTNASIRKSSRIASVDDSTTLTLQEAIAGQTNGQAYKVKHSAWYRSASNNFLSTTSGSENLHLKTTADAVDAGTSLSSTFTDDIDRETRGSTWDMGADEFTGSFLYRRAITIDHTKLGSSCSSDLSDFPVLLKLSGEWLKTKSENPNGRISSSSGWDILFKNDVETMVLKHEIEKYDGSEATAGTLVAWVKVPTIYKNRDTTIYIYYGNAAISAETEQPGDVWDSSVYKGVWHLEESSGDALDSTSYGSNAGMSGTITRPSTGQIGNAYDFGMNGQVACLDIGDGHLDFDTGSFTFSFWLNVDDTTGNYQLPIWKGSTTQASPGYDFEINDSATAIYFGITDDSNTPGGHKYSPGASLSLDTWTYIAGVVDRANNKLRIYKNGAEQGTGTDITSVGDVSSDNYLLFPIADYDLDGLIDEVRASSVARDGCWLETEFNNQYDPSAFIYSIGSEVSPAPTGVSLSSFAATAYEGGKVLLKWRTGYEVDNLGFDVYREEGGKKVRLTSEPIKGSALLSGPGHINAGHSYSWWDTSARADAQRSGFSPRSPLPATG